MMMEFISVLLAFLALINPMQKLFVIISLQQNYSTTEIKQIVNKSNRIALEVLLVFLFIGELILNLVFHLEIYAFQTTCGIVLLYNGFIGLQRGTYIEIEANTSMDDIIVVPIAVPMIAGPAALTAVVSMPSIYGLWVSLMAIIMAITINWFVMRNADGLTKVLMRYNVLMPLIRIIGLIVAAIGTQMIFNGIATFVRQI